jgi:ketosteroid isomerase-like protein
MSEEQLEELLSRCRRDHHSWINGDGSPYALPEDGTVMGAVGGYSFGGAQTAARQAAVASQWTSGTGEVELVNGGVEGDFAWLAMIERARVVLDGSMSERRWDLRVTEVFRRVDGSWQRIHRHADPLVDRRTPAEAADLLA